MSSQKSSALILLAALGLLAGFSGCASVATQPSAFLDHQEQLATTKPNDTTASYRADTAIAGYPVAIVETVTLQPAAVAKLSAEEQMALVQRLTTQARKIFATRFTPVEAAAGNALRVRITVRDIDKSSPSLNVLSAALAFVPLDSGAIAVEMEAVDALHGTRFAALTAVRKGQPLSPSDFKGSFSATGHAEEGFAAVTREFLQLLTSPASHADTAAAAVP